MPPANSPPNRTSPSRWLAWGETLLIGLVFFCLAGDPPPGVNEAHYLGRCRHWWNPDWCARDFFLESAEAHPLFVTTCGWIAHFCTLPTAAWFGRALTWFAIAAAWRRLSWLVLPMRGAAVLSAALMAVLISRTEFAGEWMIGGFEAKGIAYVLVLMGLSFAVQNKWNAAWLAFGAGSAYHALVGGWSTLLVFIEWLLWRRSASELRRMAPGLLIGGAIALVGILPALRLSASAPAEVRGEANRIYVFERLPHHLAPLSEVAEWLLERIPRHLAGLALLATGLMFVRFEKGVGLAALQTEGGASNTQAACLPTFSNLQLGRLWRIARFAVLALGLSVVGLVVEALGAAKPQTAGILKFYWFRIADVAVPWASALVWTTLTYRWLASRRPRGVVLLFCLLAFTGYRLGKQVIFRYPTPIAQADRAILDHDAWRDVCDWANANTAPTDLFLTPRMGVSFKWRAERPEVVTNKDIPQSAAEIVEWRQRLHDVFGATDSWGNSSLVGDLGELGGERAQQLAKKYGAQFVLAGAANPLSLPVAYRNRAYVVYDLRQIIRTQKPPAP